MYTPSKWATLLIAAILLRLPSAAPQPICGGAAASGGETFANNSNYEANLNAVISTLSNISTTGFLNATAGRSPDAVNAIALCRGDISPPACRDCVSATAPATARRCPNQKTAVFWNETCMVRYSGEPIAGILETEPVSRIPSTIAASNPQRHDTELAALLERLTDAAAGAVRKVAAGNRTAADVQTIFALVQCTPDLSAVDCGECLRRGINDISTCCGGVIGAGILRPSCTLRFESYRFYEASMVEVPQEPPITEKGSDRTVIVVVVSVSVFVILVVFVAILIWRRKLKQRRPVENVESVEDVSTDECQQYDLVKIKVATNDFAENNKLGEGGFGSVYKGIFPDGQEIAVKRLSMGSGQGDIEFKNEVLLMGRLQHRNLVRLLGFCLEGNERLLVYEFIQNASLDNFLFDYMKRTLLDWDTRFKIIRGIARGLLYLHEDSRFRIIHRDLKASNVLLDGDMNPKIADFGMARLFGEEETQRNTNRIVGTFGYMSPEYVIHGHISVKMDVFSFGVLVLEIMSGRKHNVSENGEVVDLLTSTWKNWRDGTPANAIDPIIMSGVGPSDDMFRCIRIGLLCVQEDAAARPTMASVVLMLGSSTMALPLPSEPAFFGGGRSAPTPENDSNVSNSSNSSNVRSSRSEDSSRNEVSVTDLYPR